MWWDLFPRETVPDGVHNFFYKNIVFWAQARYSYKNLDSQAEIILRIFLFLLLYSRILLLFDRILQFQPQGIPRILLIFYEISA